MTAVPCVAFEQPRAQADQAPGRDGKDHVGVFVVRGHVDQLAAAAADQLHHRRRSLLGHLDDERLERLLGHAVALVEDHLRLADGDFVALAAHGLDEHGEVQDAAAGDGELLGAGDRLDPQGDVFLQLLQQPLAEVAAGEVRPSCPASGEVLTPKVIFSVGSSTTTRGSARGTPDR